MNHQHLSQQLLARVWNATTSVVETRTCSCCAKYMRCMLRECEAAESSSSTGTTVFGRGPMSIITNDNRIKIHSFVDTARHARGNSLHHQDHAHHPHRPVAMIVLALDLQSIAATNPTSQPHYKTTTLLLCSHQKQDGEINNLRPRAVARTRAHWTRVCKAEAQTNHVGRRFETKRRPVCQIARVR